MNFLRMEMLLLLWLAPLLVLVRVWGARRRRTLLRGFASPETLHLIAPEMTGTRRWIKATLFIAAVIFTILSLSGPRYGYQWQTLRQRGVDIMIALDCSRSMNATDISPSRLERAKRKIMDLLTLLAGDRVGLTAFAGTAFLQCPLTLDYAAFHLFLNALSPDYLPVGGTDLAAALTIAMDGFDPDSAADKAIILITDGEHTGDGDPLKAAAQLRDRGIKLFCIGVGNADGVPIPEKTGGFKKDRKGQMVLSRLDEALLQQMAAFTGGAYVRSVAGDMDLEAIYTHEIRRTLSADTVSSGRRQVWEDRFQWPLVLAMLCLLAELMIPVTPKNLAVLAMAAFLGFPVAAARADDIRDGVQAYEAEQFEKALTHFTTAQLGAPDAPQSLYNVGCAYYKIGDFDAAADHFRQVLETDPKTLEKSGLKAHTLYNLGNSRFRQNDINGAISSYEAALALSPEDPLIRDNLAFAKAALEHRSPSQTGSSGKSSDTEQTSPDVSESDTSEKTAPHSEDSNASQPPPESEDPSGAPDVPKDSPEGSTGDSPSAPSSGTEASDDEPTPSESPAGPPPAPSSPAGDPGQAQRLLNRLEDRPGRALMPAGRPRPVEKDW